jgi:hypothetical protein
VADDTSTRVLENPRLLPPAWLVTRIRVLDRQQVLEAVRASRLPEGTLFDPERTALLEERPAAWPGPREASGVAAHSAATATLVASAPGRLRYRTRADSPALLVMREPFYPGWQARVDGRDAEVVRANYMLRAVALEPGEHDVDLRYRPRSALLGGAVSLSAALALVAAVAIQGWRSRLR